MMSPRASERSIIAPVADDEHPISRLVITPTVFMSGFHESDINEALQVGGEHAALHGPLPRYERLNTRHR